VSSRWRLYYWQAGNQFLIGDPRIIVDLFGDSGRYYTIRYTRSRRPKTLIDFGSIEMAKKKKNQVLVTGTAATYRRVGTNLYTCDLEELAREYANWGNVPPRIGDKRAQEIALLSAAFLVLNKKLKRLEVKTK